ncbi:hypothetical protein OIU83_17660 [Flavobacterium sp. LS1R49]|uniref:Uncharacterized protein n=1 Tax=Flavobacterium shii TaxID=2987687 RepID=A0A9X2ZIW5_9FLAO|nr:hypothetical protein [Flavobacterium shii]MCV9929492.1 hypothetical protein [Flavobacterium shii]
MRENKIPKRLIELGLVLQYDSEVFKCELKEEQFLTWIERLLINRERAKIMSGDTTYTQTKVLESKIEAVLIEVKKSNWHPFKEIEYAKVI